MNSNDPERTVFPQIVVWHNILYTAIYIWSGSALTPKKKGVSRVGRVRLLKTSDGNRTRATVVNTEHNII
jgi:hypothetical protein